MGAVKYEYTLRFPKGEVSEAAGVLDPVDIQAPWLAQFWAGCFDADALCAYMSGTLSL